MIVAIGRWTVTGASSGSSGRSTVKPPVSTGGGPISSSGSQAGDQVWKGRKLRLVMEDTFSKPGVDTSKWEQEVTLSGGGVSI